MIKEENKYFTPDIEDIRVGYECYWIKDPSKEIEINNLLLIKFTPKQVAFTLFAPINWERKETDNFRPNLGSYVVPYLTKEQIEKEGWKCFAENKETTVWAASKNGYSFITDSTLILSIINKTNQCLFRGQCKDINTLRYITKLLNIK